MIELYDDLPQANKAEVGVCISKVTVMSIIIETVNDGHKWYWAMFVVILNNKKQTMVKSEKDKWISGEYQGMMMKTRAAINRKSESLRINVIGGNGSLHMESE